MMNLSAEERATKMKHILGRENGALAEFVIELAAFDREKQYLDLGYRSLWEFCKRALGLSERATYYRTAAAREVQKNPQLAQQIRDGRLCITTLATLSKVMTEDNSTSLVTEAAGKSTREVDQIVARYDPKPVPADVVREITGAPSAPKVQTEVLTETMLRKHMTVGREYEDLLSAARDALSHTMPGASEVDVLMEGLRRIIRDAEKRKGIVDKPRADKVGSEGAISQSVKRIVWKRDEGKCQWRTADGGICGSTHQVEFHHKQDRGKGGLGSPENVILLCTTHNFLAAQVAWGEGFMERFRKPRQSAPEERQPQLDFS